MQPLTDIEYAIIDYLADGTQPLAALLRDLQGGGRPWELGAIIIGLVRLAERAFIRYSRMPGGPHFEASSADAIQGWVTATLRPGPPAFWVELTEGGQDIWENWQQAA